jgi:hypothetical protein
MAQNQFESLSDKLLFRFLKIIYANLISEGVRLNTNTKMDGEISGLISSSLKPAGFNTLRYLEEDYLLSTLKLNLQSVESGNLDGNLDRPELTEYKFNVSVSETVYQTQTYENTVESYGNPYDLVKTMEYNGDFDYWDGYNINTDIHDSETTEVDIDRRSFRER